MIPSDVDVVLNALDLDPVDWAGLSEKVQLALLKRFVLVTDAAVGDHTPGPYTLGMRSVDRTYIPTGSYYIFDGSMHVVGIVAWNTNKGDRKANADFIIRAMNEQERRDAESKL